MGEWCVRASPDQVSRILRRDGKQREEGLTRALHGGVVYFRSLASRRWLQAVYGSPLCSKVRFDMEVAPGTSVPLIQ